MFIYCVCLFCSPGDGGNITWVILNQISPNTTTYTVHQLIPGRTYRFRLRAVNEFVSSAPGSDLRVFVPFLGPVTERSTRISSSKSEVSSTEVIQITSELLKLTSEEKMQTSTQFPRTSDKADIVTSEKITGIPDVSSTVQVRTSESILASSTMARKDGTDGITMSGPAITMETAHVTDERAATKISAVPTATAEKLPMSTGKILSTLGDISTSSNARTAAVSKSVTPGPDTEEPVLSSRRLAATSVGDVTSAPESVGTSQPEVRISTDDVEKSTEQQQTHIHTSLAISSSPQDTSAFDSVVTSKEAAAASSEPTTKEAPTSFLPDASTAKPIQTSKKTEGTSEKPDLTSRPPVVTTKEVVITSMEVQKSSEKVVTSKEPIMSSQEIVMSSKGPVATSMEQTLSSKPPSSELPEATSRILDLTSKEPGMTSKELFVTSREPVVTSGKDITEDIMPSKQATAKITEDVDLSSKQTSVLVTTKDFVVSSKEPRMTSVEMLATSGKLFLTSEDQAILSSTVQAGTSKLPSSFLTDVTTSQSRDILTSPPSSLLSTSRRGRVERDVSTASPDLSTGQMISDSVTTEAVTPYVPDSK